MENGWVKLHRQVLTNEVFRHDHMAWHVFEVLLLLADKKRKSWSGGLNQLSVMCDMNRNTVYKCILRLEVNNMVNRTVNGRYTLYNIVNYELYQSDGKQLGKQLGKRPVNARYTAGKRPVKLIQEKEKEKEYIKINKKNLAHEVIDHYNQVHEKTVKYLDGRILKIQNRLKQYTLEEIKTAITNAKSDSFFMGSKGWTGDLDYLVRSDENIEKYLNLKTKPSKGLQGYGI